MTTIDNEQAAPLPSKPDIQDVLNIVGRATAEKRPTLPHSSFELKMLDVQQKLLAHAIGPGVAMCISALLAIWFESRPWVDTMLVLAIISELLVIAMMGFSIVGGTPSLWRLRKEPYSPFLTLLRMSTDQDLLIIHELSRCSKQALQYVLTQYRQERNAHERRSGMVAGTIEKVGIFPALAGLVITISNLMKVSEAIAWGSFFGPSLLVFYILAVTSVQMTQKMDRVIALLEFSIQAKK